MRYPSETLLAAQLAASRAPSLSLRVEDRPPLADRLDWAEIPVAGLTYRRSSGAAAYDNGFVARIANTPAGDVAACYDDLTGPDPTWQQIGTGAAPTGDSVCCCTIGDDAWFFWVSADGRHVYGRLASNHQASWGDTTEAFMLQEEQPGNVRAIAATAYTVDHVLLAIGVNPGGANPNDYLHVVRKTPTGWHLSTPTAGLWYDITGLAIAVHTATVDLTTFIVVTDYTPETGSSLSVMGWGEAAETWHFSRLLIPGAPASGIEYRSPSIIYSPVDDVARFFIGYMEYFSATPADERPTYFWTTNPYRPGLPIPHQCHDYNDWGMHFVQTAAFFYLLGVDKGYKAPRYSSQFLADLGPDLLAFDLRQDEARPGQLTIWLDDSTRKYHDAGEAGTNLPLRPASQVILGLGYRTPAGPEQVFDANWWIVSTRREQYRAAGARQGPGTAALVLECIDTYAWLASLQSPYTTVWADYTVADLLIAIVSHVAGDYSVVWQAELDRVLDNALVDVGDSFIPLVRKLLRECGYTLRFQTNQTGEGGPASLYAHFLPAFAYEVTDAARPIGAAGEAYVPGEAYLLAAAEEHHEITPNHIEVYGPLYHGEAYDWPAVNSHHVVVKHSTMQTTTDEETSQIAAALLAWETMSTRRAEVTIPYDVGLELADSVALTCPWLDLTAAPRFIRGLRGRYSCRPPRYDLTLTLHGQD